jgi:hypothetical protein
LFAWEQVPHWYRKYQYQNETLFEQKSPLSCYCFFPKYYSLNETILVFKMV